MKFGGTSVADAERIEQCAQIVKHFESKKPVVVTSALADVTNSLLETADLALAGNREEVENMLERY